MDSKKILRLLRQHSKIITQLKNAGIIRSANNPVGDYAEWLVAKRLKLNLESNSTKSYDATDPKTKKTYQIKGRRLTKKNGSRQLGVMRTKDFDFLAAVIFNEDFTVQEAYLIPKKIIKSPYVRYSDHQHGEILILRGKILTDKNIIKIKL
jgi:hypothetical protein